MKPLFAVLSLLLASGLAAQSIDVSVDVTNATCQANGAVTVNVSGGSDDYRYTLTNTCGDNFPPQNTPTFTTLIPCDYVIVVVDRQTGAQEAVSFEVLGTNEPLSARVGFSDCDAAIIIAGGNGPYEVTYTTPNGTESLTTSTLIIDLPPLGNGDVSGTVIDACGNSRSFNGSGDVTAIQTFTQLQTDTGLVFIPTGGSAPYTFELTSSLGTFNSTTGVFPWSQVGCTPELSINSACAGGALDDVIIGLDLQMEWGCVNFAEGYAEVLVTPPGRGPFTYEIDADGQTFTQTDSVFTNLPVNAGAYTLSVTDACGQMPNFFLSITRYQVDLLGEASACSDTEIAIRVDRQCSGPLFAPLTLSCENCPAGTENIQIERGVDTTFFTGQPIGSWDILVRDDCGDSLRCQDEIILEAISACDSIITNLTQILNCDNGTFSRRIIRDPSLVFSLEDGAGTVLESGNATGNFTGISPGTYLVRGQSACGIYSASVTVNDPTAIDPFFDFFPSFDQDVNGDCQLTYGLRLEQLQGPFVITGGPDGSFYEIFNDYDQDNCAFYDNESILLPGDYTITSFSSCGSLDFTLPEVVEPRIDSINILSNCPGASVIEVFGLVRNNGDYREWWLNQGIRIGTTSNLGDYYYVNETIYQSPVITGLPPGQHTMAIIPRFSASLCPVDTFTFVIPEYEPVRLQVEGDILCDTSGTVPLRLFPERGNGPYVLREVDCADPSNVLATYPVAIGAAADVPVVSIGTYCFVVEDDCGITADFQVEVRGINGNIDVTYNCTPSITFATDTLPGIFSWFAADGSLLGNATSVTVPPPVTDTEYTLEVDIGTCILRENIPFAARPFLPALDILEPASGEVVQCDMDTVTLVAATDTFSFISWDEPFVGDTLVTVRNGVRTVTATNDLGCITTRAVFVRRVISPNPQIGPSPNFCFGDTLSLGIDGEGLRDIDWSTGALDQDSILISGTGFYAVSVTDFAGCAAVDTFTFVEPGPVAYSLGVDSISCFDARDGAVQVMDLMGGTPGYTFTLNGREYAPGQPIDGLDIGQYQFRAQDSHGCALDTAFTLGQPDSLSVYIGERQLVFLGTLIDLPIATNADTLVGVEWFTFNPLEGLSETLYRLTAITTDSISIQIMDSRGCVATNGFRLIVDRGVSIYVPNAFSPNGDGVNDRFVVQGLRSQIL
ncbi:MAG: hypothetical protein AAF597_01480, partial [Bacteroidota bacterium]